jgi:hypothetical protein
LRHIAAVVEISLSYRKPIAVIQKILIFKLRVPRTTCKNYPELSSGTMLRVHRTSGILGSWRRRLQNELVLRLNKPYKT